MLDGNGRCYRFVGTEQDSAKWKDEYDALYR